MVTAAMKLKDICYLEEWRRKWQPTPVLLPKESHGQRSLAGYSPWGRKESDMTERFHSLTHSLGRKTMTNLDSILKSRDITLMTKVHIVRSVVLLVVMYRYKSWTIKKAERPRIGIFELWCWRRLLSPLDSKEIKPVNPKGNQP